MSFQHLPLSSVLRIPEGTFFYTSDQEEQSCASRENAEARLQEKGVLRDGFSLQLLLGAKPALMLGHQEDSKELSHMGHKREQCLPPTSSVGGAQPHAPVILTEI